MISLRCPCWGRRGRRTEVPWQRFYGIYWSVWVVMPCSSASVLVIHSDNPRYQWPPLQGKRTQSLYSRCSLTVWGRQTFNKWTMPGSDPCQEGKSKVGGSRGRGLYWAWERCLWDWGTEQSEQGPQPWNRRKDPHWALLLGKDSRQEWARNQKHDSSGSMQASPSPRPPHKKEDKRSHLHRAQEE